MNTLFNVQKLNDWKLTITNELVDVGNELRNHDDDAKYCKMLYKEITELQKINNSLTKLIDYKQKMILKDGEEEKPKNFRTRS